MRFFIVASIALLGCQPSPVPVPPPQPDPVWFDAGPPSPFVTPDAGISRDPCQRACATEARLKCVGSEPQCVATCRRVVASRLTNLPLACIAAAKTCAAQAACR